MNTFWNKGEKEIIKGLDILGLRRIDQHIETQLVASITTISSRARYLSLIPWLAGEFFYAYEGQKGLDRDEMYHRLMQVYDRLELVIILSTQIEKSKNPNVSDTGIIGQEIHEKWVAAFHSDHQVDAIILKEKSKRLNYINPTFGTYYNPCRGFGLLSHSSSAPVGLPPHGQAVYNARKGYVQRDNGVLSWLLHGGVLTQEMIEKESELFSIANIDSVPEEMRLLQESFLMAYTDDTEVVETYKRFDNTILWILEHIREPKKPPELIQENFDYCTGSQWADLNETELMWFEFELRRRVHYALELLLKALSYTVEELNGATVERVVYQWREDIELSDVFPEGRAMYVETMKRFSDRTDLSAFTRKEPIEPSEQALYALSYLEISRKVSLHLMPHMSNAGSSADYMRKAFDILKKFSTKKMHQTLGEIIRFCVVEPHVKTTLRKMGQGQQCSLRFFPEGQKLMPTGIDTYAGWSGSRLDNTVRMMADIGLCDEVDSRLYKQNEMSGKVIARLREAV